MKNLYLFIAATNLFFLNAFAQKEYQGIAVNETVNANRSDVAYYYVEERINMSFGAQVTTYTVSDLSLISTIDLGPNNSRIITPKYAKQKSSRTSAKVAIASPAAIDEIVEKRPTSVNIDLIATYERVLEKGYKSEKLLKSVANEYFFNGNLAAAAKWYNELFAMNTDLEAMYYFRYAKSLASVNQLEKSAEMMKLFEKKNL
ncbi:hypothetical protein FNO01nite_00470 [Flavobacterium noncentrifugens]|uniref:Tetratricopeptide repeat-containing protein n=1 Tax=Flavobacterium noncentrifugens TaxID=1128970 RepID=A0A1G8RC65_9FLAO|nr:hypothetical protein [Flavobacterium noncentrifugens]GEP49375.1 hypothetical protein FNO01nite_00470 [Flavobacterium noncentrifugens]SDJ14556.1 hypothetical protein SAMN04487935_0056 [Flavobacterium noncentrifugens]